MIVLLLVALAVTAPTVTGVEVTSPHLLPSPRPDQFLTNLVGQPLSRHQVGATRAPASSPRTPVGRPRPRDRGRGSLERLWALEVFDSIQVEEIEEPGGIRL